MSERIVRNIVCVMGVSGSGKSTVGEGLAERMHAAFLEGDTFHPDENRRKMASGVPLTDEDREPWVQRMCDVIAAFDRDDARAVLACSGLRRAHRDRLRDAGIELFIHMHGDPRIILARLKDREQSGHYMKADMLESQLEALEMPGEDEPVVRIDIELGIDEQVGRAVAAIEADS